jgi:hypothetical protein
MEPIQVNRDTTAQQFVCMFYGGNSDIESHKIDLWHLVSSDTTNIWVKFILS